MECVTDWAGVCTTDEVSCKEGAGSRPLVLLAVGRCPSEWKLPLTWVPLCPLGRLRGPRAGRDPHEKKENIRRQGSPGRRG